MEWRGSWVNGFEQGFTCCKVAHWRCRELCYVTTCADRFILEMYHYSNIHSARSSLPLSHRIVNGWIRQAANTASFSSRPCRDLIKTAVFARLQEIDDAMLLSRNVNFTHLLVCSAVRNQILCSATNFANKTSTLTAFSAIMVRVCGAAITSAIPGCVAELSKPLLCFAVSMWCFNSLMPPPPTENWQTLPPPQKKSSFLARRHPQLDQVSCHFLAHLLTSSAEEEEIEIWLAHLVVASLARTISCTFWRVFTSPSALVRIVFFNVVSRSLAINWLHRALLGKDQKSQSTALFFSLCLKSVTQSTGPCVNCRKTPSFGKFCLLYGRTARPLVQHTSLCRANQASTGFLE